MLTIYSVTKFVAASRGTFTPTWVPDAPGCSLLSEQLVAYIYFNTGLVGSQGIDAKLHFVG